MSKFAAMLVTAFALATAVNVSIRAGEGEKPAPRPPEAEAPKGAEPEGERKIKKEKDKEKDREKDADEARRAAARAFGNREGGRDGGPPPWAGGGGGGMFGRSNNVMSMVSRMLGIDIEDPKAGPKVDTLPLGVDKRMVLRVPVGGVDNPAGSGEGWKMEHIFKLTEEQTKAVDTLREEYKAEQKKLEDEILAQQKALAEKVKQLRLKYELRANDILTGEDKQAKEKMDALSKELNTKNEKIVTETLPLYDNNDMAQGLTMIRAIREKTSANVKEAETKLVELVPAENREKIADVIKRQSEERERMTRWMGGRQREGGDERRPEGERRERRPGGGDPVKPPRPPETPPGQGNF